MKINVKTNWIKELLNNNNFRNNQNYIINYKTLKKKYFTMNLKNEDKNFWIQLLFIILYLIWLVIIIYIWLFFYI